MTMRVRTILMAVMVVGAALGAVGAEAQQTVTWKAALFGPPRALTKPVDWWAHEVTTRTNGQVKIELIYGEALAKATEIPEGLRAGAFEMGLFCAAYYPGKFPLYTVLDLPMLTPDDVRVQARAEIALGEHPALVAELKRWNAKLLLPAPLPQYQIMGQKKITRAEDFKGLRIRVSGEMARVLEDFGAVKSLVPAPEVYPSLERGVVDAVAFPATYAFFSYRVHEIAKYFIDRISLGSQPCFYGVNLAAWEKLTPAQQKIMLDLREPVVQQFYEVYAADDAKNYDLFKQKGVELVNFPPAERARLTANAEKHWQAWVEEKEKRGLPGRSVLEFVQGRLRARP